MTKSELLWEWLDRQYRMLGYAVFVAKTITWERSIEITDSITKRSIELSGMKLEEMEPLLDWENICGASEPLAGGQLQDTTP